VGAEVIGRNESVIEIEILERILINLIYERTKNPKKLVLSEWEFRIPRRGQSVREDRFREEKAVLSSKMMGPARITPHHLSEDHIVQ
jgi:hypothetical protein